MIKLNEVKVNFKRVFLTWRCSLKYQWLMGICDQQLQSDKKQSFWEELEIANIIDKGVDSVLKRFRAWLYFMKYISSECRAI